MGKPKKLKFRDIPEYKKLLHSVSKNITPNDVLFLSELDYGQEAQKHAAKINLFRETLDTSKMDSWYPMEVWELNRWSSPGYLDKIGHSRRAFSCAALLACTIDDVRASIELLDVVLPLYESLVRLDLPEWHSQFTAFLEDGIGKMINLEDRFKLQLVRFLTFQSSSSNSSAIANELDQLMNEEMKMLRGYKGNNEIKRPSKIVDTYITHGTAYMFVAKEIYAKSKQTEMAELSMNLLTLSQRFAGLNGEKVTDFLPMK